MTPLSLSTFFLGVAFVNLKRFIFVGYEDELFIVTVLIGGCTIVYQLSCQSLMVYDRDAVIIMIIFNIIPAKPLTNRNKRNCF